MSQDTTFGEAVLDVYAKVDRADGSVEYYRVLDGENVPITAAEYAAANEEN